jgi:hypothetical protein
MRRSQPRKGGNSLRRRRVKPVDKIMAGIWREDIGACAVCPAEGVACRGPVQSHHLIAKGALKRRHLDEHLWDKRNRLAVCEWRHEQHTTRFKPIPRELLPPAVWEFAEELGLTYLIERAYPPEEDERAVA